MTQRQHDTRYLLRKALVEHGAKSNQTRLAAIEFCHAHNIDPHWRTAVYPKTVILPPEDWDRPVLDDRVYAVSEWERVVARFTKEDT